MTIVATDSIQTVLDAHDDAAPSATELTAWNAATNYGTAADHPVTKLGLWGEDLTAFNADCLISTLCAAKDYTMYNGWALGVDFTSADDLAANGFDGVVIEDLLWGV